RPAHQLEGEKRPALLVAHDPEVVQRIGVVLVGLQHREIDRLGLLELAAPVQGDRRGEPLLAFQDARSRRAATTRPSTCARPSRRRRALSMAITSKPAAARVACTYGRVWLYRPCGWMR